MLNETQEKLFRNNDSEPIRSPLITNLCWMCVMCMQTQTTRPIDKRTRVTELSN